jgi:hypothetical protein
LKKHKHLNKETNNLSVPPMSEAEIMANALSDPDNPPITEADLARL